jgi:hypothetical protein
MFRPPQPYVLLSERSASFPARWVRLFAIRQETIPKRNRQSIGHPLLPETGRAEITGVLKSLATAAAMAYGWLKTRKKASLEDSSATHLVNTARLTSENLNSKSLEYSRRCSAAL